MERDRTMPPKKAITDLRLFAIGDQWGAEVEFPDGTTEPIWAVNGNEGTPDWEKDEKAYEEWYNRALDEAHRQGYILEGEASCQAPQIKECRQHEQDRGGRNGPTPPTYAAFRHELDQLVSARRIANSAGVCRSVRYERLANAIEKSGLPYRLVQEVCDDVGVMHSGYRYRFKSDWDGPALLYIQETRAGRQQYRTPLQAMDALEQVLNERAAEAHRREFYGRPEGATGV